MEVLAPAGGAEQLLAAVRSGADAVYLGTKAFNARRKADNFGGSELRQAVAYCHGRGVRVHVTVNTLVSDGELSALFDTVREIGESGADAVILQDLAALRLFRTHLPSIACHASTQMTIHNAEGARAAQELGFSRVILGRELSLAEIRRIRDSVDIELECFVHGALCMGISGQCLLSAVLGERSGNRGLCAQPCRLNFRAGERPYALSLKDACLIPHLRELSEAGVCSLKIEGRLRRPEYVAAATEACVRALRGEQPDLQRLEKAFSRSGFTDGYLMGKRDLSMFGRRTERDKQSGEAVMGDLAALYRRELSRVPVQMGLSVQPGSPVVLCVSDGSRTVSSEGELPRPVQTKEQDAAGVLGKTGGTPFVLKQLKLEVAPGWMAPGLSALRREALERLLAERERATPHPLLGDFIPERQSSGIRIPRLRIRLETREQLWDCPEAEAVYLPVEQIDETVIHRLGDRLIGELPRMVFPMQEAALERLLVALRRQGLRWLCAGNLGTVHLAKRLGFRISGGFDLNIWNSQALAQYADLGVEETLLSLEIRIRDAAALGGKLPRGLVVYGYLPLMLFRCCPMQGKNGCGDCSGRRSLTDRQGTDFSVLCHRRSYSQLLNAVPLYLGDKTLRGLDFGLLYYTTEAPEVCREIWARYRAAAPWPGQRTNGPYYRALL